jgi:hypothetical protein
MMEGDEMEKSVWTGVRGATSSNEAHSTAQHSNNAAQRNGSKGVWSID